MVYIDPSPSSHMLTLVNNYYFFIFSLTVILVNLHNLMLLLWEELEREGIWDFDRLSRPYIRQELLRVIEFFLLAVIC